MKMTRFRTASNQRTKHIQNAKITYAIWKWLLPWRRYLAQPLNDFLATDLWTRTSWSNKNYTKSYKARGKGCIARLIAVSGMRNSTTSLLLTNQSQYLQCAVTNTLKATIYDIYVACIILSWNITDITLLYKYIKRRINVYHQKDV